MFDLFSDIHAVRGVGPKIAECLENLDISKPKDLLFLLPSSVVDRRVKETVLGTQLPAIVTVAVTVGRHMPNTQKGRPYRVLVRDEKTEFQLVFFHPRSDWIKTSLPQGQRRIVSGKTEIFDGVAQMVHPDHILRPEGASQLPKFEPRYPLTAGVSHKVMTRAIASQLPKVPALEEWIDAELRADKGWSDWKTSIIEAHSPTSPGDISPGAPARERLAYDEFFAHQVTLALARQREKRSAGVVSKPSGRLQDKVLKSLPFAPTRAQTRAVSEILDDMREPLKMNRLLQGDVGSGKTLVAMLSALGAVEAGGQAALMAPTEILAQQHYFALEPLAKSAGVALEVLTGRDKGADRAKKLARLAAGEIDILVGTHALFQKDVVFKNLRFTVVDEQHRFGVRQRLELSEKGRAVDVLVMTATPIPRSLELAHYGDMDVSVLDEKPAGRLPIETALVHSDRLEQVVDRLAGAIAEGRQAYWVCPLVSESEVMEVTAAEERFKALRARFPDGEVALVHGQMPVAEKDAAMAEFSSGRAKILVATTVIEVGVDVPNASIIVIEGAEKFGLSQLHQLRGRVGRGHDQSTCLLIYNGVLGDTAAARLAIMRETNDGFRIAEEDLKLRGAGDVLGVAQSGLPKFKIADAESQTGLMKTAHSDARNLLARDPKLTSERGKAVRVLLHLMEQEKAFRMISVG